MEVLDFPDNAQILFHFSMKTLILPPLLKTSFGKWRSPVAHLYGVQGVASSNLVFPTSPVIALRAMAGLFNFKLTDNCDGLLRARHGLKFRTLSCTSDEIKSL
jgi:hypothetical protein